MIHVTCRRIIIIVLLLIFIKCLSSSHPFRHFTDLSRIFAQVYFRSVSFVSRCPFCSRTVRSLLALSANFRYFSIRLFVCGHRPALLPVSLSTLSFLTRQSILASFVDAVKVQRRSSPFPSFAFGSLPFCPSLICACKCHLSVTNDFDIPSRRDESSDVLDENCSVSENQIFDFPAF
jgi:hypothetical protein